MARARPSTRTRSSCSTWRSPPRPPTPRRSSCWPRTGRPTATRPRSSATARPTPASLAETEYLAREIAAVRLAVDQKADRDEIFEVLERLTQAVERLQPAEIGEGPIDELDAAGRLGDGTRRAEARPASGEAWWVRRRRPRRRPARSSRRDRRRCSSSTRTRARAPSSDTPFDRWPATFDTRRSRASSSSTSRTMRAGLAEVVILGALACRPSAPCPRRPPTGPRRRCATGRPPVRRRSWARTPGP